MPSTATRSARRWCMHIRVLSISRKTSSRPSTTASSTSRRRPSQRQGDVLADKDPHFTAQFLQRHPRIRLARVTPATRAIENQSTEAVKLRGGDRDSATIFERETLGQRWSNPSFIPLSSIRSFPLRGSPRIGSMSGAATTNKSKNELGGHHFTVGVIETLRFENRLFRPM